MYKHEMTKRKMGARIGLESRHEGIERILGSKRGGRGGARRNTAASARARNGFFNIYFAAESKHRGEIDAAGIF